MNNSLKGLMQSRNLLYVGIVLGVLLIASGCIGLGKLFIEFSGKKIAIIPSISIQAQVRAYSPTEIAKEEVKIRAMEVKLGVIPHLPEQAKFSIPIERSTETDSVEQQVMDAINFLKEVPMSERMGRTWNDFFISQTRRITYEKFDTIAIMRSVADSGEVIFFVQSLLEDVSCFKNPRMRIASALIHEAGHIANDKSVPKWTWRGTIVKAFFSVINIWGIKTWRDDFIYGGQLLQKERSAICIEKKFLDDAAKLGKYDNFNEIYETSTLYTIIYAFIIDRLDIIANSVILALVGILSIVGSFIVLVAIIVGDIYHQRKCMKEFEYLKGFNLLRHKSQSK